MHLSLFKYLCISPPPAFQYSFYNNTKSPRERSLCLQQSPPIVVSGIGSRQIRVWSCYATLLQEILMGERTRPHNLNIIITYWMNPISQIWKCFSTDGGVNAAITTQRRGEGVTLGTCLRRKAEPVRDRSWRGKVMRERHCATKRRRHRRVDQGRVGLLWDTAHQSRSELL